MFGQFLSMFQPNILPSSRGTEKTPKHVWNAIRYHCGNSRWKEI